MSGTVIDDQLGLPYTGPYGDGEYLQAGGEAEQRLQMQRTIEFIEEQADPDVRAILAGTIYSGPEVTATDGTVLIAEDNPAPFEILDDAFLWLVAANHELSCNVCPDNPAGGSHVSNTDFGSMTSHLFGRGFRQHDVLDTSLLFREATVPITTTAGDELLIPMSQHYGVRSAIRVAQ
jgi:hypothetical protein